jgi:hypothetical protein
MPRLPNLPVWSDKRREARAFVLKTAYQGGVYNYSQYSAEIKKLINVEKTATAKRQAKQEAKQETKEQERNRLRKLATKLSTDAKPKKGVVSAVKKYQAKDTGYWTTFKGEKVYMNGMISARHFDYSPALFVNYPFGRAKTTKYGYDGYNIYKDGNDIAKKVAKDVVKNIRPAKTATHIYVVRVEFKLYVEQKDYDADKSEIPNIKETDRRKYLNRSQVGDLIQDDDGNVFKIEERRFIAYQNTYNKADMLEEIHREVDIQFNKDYATVYNVIGYDIILIKQPRSAGCDGREHTVKMNGMTCISPKTANRNCLFACINRSMDIKNNVRKPDVMRQECNIKPNTLITLAQHEAIAKKYDLTITTYGITGAIIQTVGSGSNLVKIMMIVGNADGEGHYVLMVNQKKVCEKCNTEWENYHSQAHCNSKQRHHLLQHKDGRMVVPAKYKDEEDDMIFFDFETFPLGEERVLTIYASGWKSDGQLYQKYGNDAGEEFMKWVMTQEKKTLCAYNGSGFDFHFILKWLIVNEVEVKDIIIANGSILSFKFGNNLKVWDLYRFTTCSLSSACKAYDVPKEICKTSFNHNLIRSWDDVIKYQTEVEPYLNNDVLAMEYIFNSQHDFFYERFECHITQWLTLSAMSYSLWTNTTDALLEIPDAKKYDYIRQAVYGGRTYPVKREFKSKEFDAIMTASEDERKQLYKQLQDWIFNADVSSLYPTAMSFYDYPVGKSEWIEDCDDVDYSQPGIYDVDVVANKSLAVPILPMKVKTGIRWSLEDRRGVYTHTDLNNAVKFGYKITKVHKALVWKDTQNVFKNYITEAYKIKDEGENESNPVKRAIGKLLMNSLYGKMLERARFTETVLCNDVKQVSKFIGSNTITDITFNGAKVLMTGSKKERDECVRKPSHLGAFVLANSRDVMFNAMTAINPKLDASFFTYTDTDSLHIHAKHLDTLEKQGWLQKGLGKLSDDCKGGKIIREINLAPKLYAYICLMPDGSIKKTNKCKGIPSDFLNTQLYETAKPTVIEMSEAKGQTARLKRVGYGQNLPVSLRGNDWFSIVSVDMSRTFYGKPWEGMRFENNEWFPHA